MCLNLIQADRLMHPVSAAHQQRMRPPPPTHTLTHKVEAAGLVTTMPVTITNTCRWERTQSRGGGVGGGRKGGGEVFSLWGGVRLDRAGDV